MQNEAHLWRLTDLYHTLCTWLQILPAPGKLLFILWEITLAVNPSPAYQPSSLFEHRVESLKTFLVSAINGLKLNLNSNGVAKTETSAEVHKFWTLHWCDHLVLLLTTCSDLSNAIVRNLAREDLFLWERSNCAFIQKDLESFPDFTNAADNKCPLKKIIQHSTGVLG